MNTGLLRYCLAIIIILSLAISSITPIVFGYDLRTIDNETLVKTYNYDRYSLSESYDCYNIDEIPGSVDHIGREYPDYDDTKSEKTIDQVGATQPLDAPLNSAWPIYCHDVRHTGRSPYSTVDTWDEIWKFETKGWAEGGPAIDEDGIIYIGSYYLDAVYPNGSLKWEFNTYGIVKSCPAIDENGILYLGNTYGDADYLYALFPNGTLKWKYWIGRDIFSSPAIGSDGTIYFGSGGGYPPMGSINAVYPNGSLKWEFNTDHVVYSSPTIGADGTVYCGSHDTYLYAIYPNNGTLRWRYKTGDWIRTSPCIADDGTVYVVSLDYYLHAVNPDGSLKWKTNVGAGTSPTIGQDGTIYAGYSELHAVNPTDGSVKWTFDVGGTIRGGTPCNSVDGTIYVGTSDGGELLVINSDGTLKWRKSIGTVESPPAIGEDGTVYVGSCGAPGEGFLNAFGAGELEADANGPYYELINSPVQFEGSSKGGHSPHSYHWDFGDTYSSDEQNPIHTYTEPGNYEVVLTVTDNEGDTATDTTFAWIQTSNNPPTKPSISGPTSGKPGNSYPYTFTANDPDESVIWYYIDWGDNTYENWVGPYSSGEQVTISHTWFKQDTYIIQVRARDPYNAESGWSELEVTTPRNRAVYNTLFYYLFEKFPILARLLNLL